MSSKKTQKTTKKSTTTQPIRDKKQVQALINYYLQRGQIRNYLLITMGIYTALRISDLLKLTVGDIYDFKQNRLHKTITIVESKTGKSKIIALNKNCLSALKHYLHNSPPHHPRQVLFANQKSGKPISRVQAYRIIRAAAEELDFSQAVSCHSLRKTFGYHSWKNGTSPAVIMEIYNHSSLSATRRYLGVCQDDKNKVYMGLDFII